MMFRSISPVSSEGDRRPPSSAKENQIDCLHQIEEDFCVHRRSIAVLLNKISNVHPEVCAPYRHFEIMLSVMMADIKNASSIGIVDFDKKYDYLCDKFSSLKNTKISEESIIYFERKKETLKHIKPFYLDANAFNPMDCF